MRIRELGRQMDIQKGREEGREKENDGVSKKRKICQGYNSKKRKVRHYGLVLQRFKIYRVLRFKETLNRSDIKTVQNCCSHTHLLTEAENKRERCRERR